MSVVPTAFEKRLHDYVNNTKFQKWFLSDILPGLIKNGLDLEPTEENLILLMIETARQILTKKLD